MFKLYIHKIIQFSFLVIFISPLNSSEPVLATLNNVITNSIQQFSIGNYSFYCKAYGMISIEEITKHNASNSICTDTINKLYVKNKELQYYSNHILKLNQLYHIEIKGDKCIVYANGEKTLTEILLERGLGRMKVRFKDKEFKYLYTKAQKRAKVEQKGIWNENIKGKCLAELEE